MGGFGSGKGFRLRGSKRKRIYVNEVPSLHYKYIELDARDVYNPVGKLHYKDLSLHFKLQTHILHGGGIWYSFSCQCGRAPRTLYLYDGEFACQKCHGLAYPIENKGKTDRAIQQKWKYAESVNNMSGLLLRPKGMKMIKFERVSYKVQKYHESAFANFFNSLS